jgi:undecaprenyl pyrophosphate synthase
MPAHASFRPAPHALECIRRRRPQGAITVQSNSLAVICHLPWRSPRQTGRRILVLPDGNSRIAANLEGYAAGADNVVACAEHLARRGDVSTLVMCIASEHNALKRDERFFQAVYSQFSRLRTNIVTKGVLLRSDIRCRARGDLARLRAMGGARAALVDEVVAACDETTSVVHPRLHVEFWLAYSDDIAWQSDVDLVIRTGAEESDVARPGLSLPPNVPFVFTSTLWPDAKPEELGRLADYALRDQVPQFAPGYDLEFVEKLLRVFPAARVPAPVHMTIPVCAPEADILAMLKGVYAQEQDGPDVRTTFACATGNHSADYGPTDDVWYTLRLVPAARWHEFSREPYDAILTPGQHTGSTRLAMPAGLAHAHSCVATAEDVLASLNKAIRFPVKHVLLHGADRSKASELATKSPWPADLLDLMHEVTQRPHATMEDFVRDRLAPGADPTAENELLIKSISAKVLAEALGQGLLLPDESVRQSDRNYAYTGAYMMLRIPDEGNPTGLSWERAAEVAIRCMLAISTGDNGVFDRMYPGETQEESRERLDQSARYLSTVAQHDTAVKPPTVHGARLLQAIGAQWQEMLAPRPHTSPALVHACHDALRRHYLANLRERERDVIDNPLVRWLCIGGLPRREAMQEIEKRYAKTTPAPIGEKIRVLLDTDVTESNRFHAVRREVQVVLHLADTAHSIAVEVLFLFCALTIPKEAVTPERLEALIAVGQLGDYAFRMANDLASLNDAAGGDQDPTKESSLSILIPKTSTVSERTANMRLARELGAATLAWLEEHLGKAIQRLREIWPSMATKVMRAVRVGRGVYANAHYTTLSADGMMALLRRLDEETRPANTLHQQTARPSTTTQCPTPPKNRLRAVIGRV